MSNVTIVTDTMSCLPDNLYKEYGIFVSPLSLNINGKGYRDKEDMTSEQFWKMFPSIKDFTTSTVSPGDMADLFRKAAKKTDSIACIVVSAALTGVYSAAGQAKDLVKSEFPGLEITVVDSKTAAGAEGFAVLEAARAAAAGKDLAEVVTVAEDVARRSSLLVAMETLKYLMKSGRAPKTAWVGELVQVKPIIGIVNGTGVVENLGRVRTTRKAMARLVDMIKDYADTSKPLHMVVHYTDRIEDGEELRDMVKAQYNCAELYMAPYTPTMAGHTGPVVSVAFYS